jgi:hypothetical protein
MVTFGLAVNFVACPSGTDGDRPSGEVCNGGILCPIVPPPIIDEMAEANPYYTACDDIFTRETFDNSLNNVTHAFAMNALGGLS